MSGVLAVHHLREALTHGLLGSDPPRAELGARQARVIEARAAQIGAHEIRAMQLGAAEIGARQDQLLGLARPALFENVVKHLKGCWVHRPRF